MKTEFENGIRFALRGLDPDDADRLAGLIADELDENVSTDGVWQVLDANVVTDGGAAFKWSDVLAIGDAVDIGGDVLGGLDPLDAVKVLMNMVLLWRRLRRVRVPLSGEEFRVLRALKAGFRTPVEISSYTELIEESVRETLQQLQERRCFTDIPLAECNNNEWSTSF